MAKKVTKKALLASVLSLSICTTMLIGTSYAWFTDSVTSSGNIIKSGTLQVGMSWANGKEKLDEATWNDVEQDGINPMFYYDLWEPGYVQARHIQVFNKGSLALKYNLTILPAENSNYDPDAEDNIASVIDVYFYDPAQTLSDRAELTDANKIGTLKDLIADPTILAADTQGHLSAKAADEADYPNKTVTLALKMQETAGNDYQDKEISAGFDVKLFATQWTEEKDTFDELYDKMATYDSTNVTNALHLSNNGATVTVPAGSANVNDVFVLNVTNNGNNTDTDGKTTASFDVKLFKNGTELSSADINNTEYTVELDVGPNLNVVCVYHNSVPVLGYTYNATTGIVTFKTKSFSPFTVEYHEPKLITFDGNTGSGTMGNQTVYAGVDAQLANNAFEKTGYSFAGWAETANGKVAYNDGESVKFTESKTLYAKWNANPYQISFNANGGTGDMANQTINYGASANLTANAYTKTGHDFMGWTATEGGTTVDYADQASYTMNTLGATLYAVWTANDYNVTFDGNGATSGSMQAQSFTFGTSANLTANAFTKTGYSFVGWATSANGEAAYADTASYTMNTEGATLYAKWAANNYNVTFDGNGATSGSMEAQSIAYDSSANLTANTFTRTGYSFAGWATSANGSVAYANQASYTMTTEGATLYAVWTEIKPTGVTIKKDGTATTSITTETSQNIQLTAEVAPGTALNTSVSWSSSNENIATVNANGLVTTKTTAGTVTIRATCNGNTSVYRECTVAVLVPVISVQYREYNTSTGSFTTKTVNAVPITGDMTTLNNTGISKGWYAVTGDVTISTRITVSGTVNLILCDSTTLEATKGINVKSGDTLNIYAQSNSGNEGVLMASGDSPKAGIGGGDGEAGGNITIHGGTVMAQGGGWLNEEEGEGEGGAGIGGGNNGAGGTITIHGGTVMTQGGPFGSGIGGGCFGIGGNITINGGNITAYSGFYASSIGGGTGGHGGKITINGGTVTANSTDGYGDAGIGGGFDGSGGTITINGGTVTAQGGECASGIGGGGYGDGGTVTINGGTVTANGGEYGGAGIGGGMEGKGANVTVSGGTVTATGNDANGISCGGKYNYNTDSFDTDYFDTGRLTIIGNLRVYSNYNCTQQNTNYPTNRTNPMVIK